VDLVWYLAYGSNMQSETLRGRRGIAYRRAVPVIAAGWRLVFDKPSLLGTAHSFANVVPDATAEVLGVAFEMTVEDLAHVEHSEGVGFGNYRSIEIAVRPIDATLADPRRAVTLASDRRDPDRRPSTRYLDLVIAGATEHDLPEAWIARLRGEPAEPESDDSARLRPLLDDLMKRR
jgi:hypothetical protein